MNLSIDSGFGIDKYAYFDDKNEIKFGKNLSVFVEADLDAEDMPLFEGKRYYIGEEALMEESSSIINVIDYKSHEKFAPLSVWGVLEKLQKKPEDINNLYVSLSLAQKEYAQLFIKRLSKFKINSQEYSFQNKINLVPQAVGAKYAIDYYFYNENHTETYAIIDIGQLTVDEATVINGKIRIENASGNSNEGIIKIIQQIQEYISTNYSEVISVKEAQKVLLTNKYYNFGEKDLTDVINGFKKNYSSYLISMLKNRYKNIFKKYGKIYFVGGGAYYLSKEEVSKEAGIDINSIIIPENAEYYNAIGGLILSSLNNK